MKQATTPTTARATKPSTMKSTSREESSTPEPSGATPSASITVGLDLSDRHSHFCVLDGGGKPLEEGKVAMLQKDLTALFTRFMSARLVRCQGSNRPANPICFSLAQARSCQPWTVDNRFKAGSRFATVRA